MKSYTIKGTTMRVNAKSKHQACQVAKKQGLNGVTTKDIKRTR